MSLQEGKGIYFFLTKYRLHTKDQSSLIEEYAENFVGEESRSVAQEPVAIEELSSGGFV